MRNARFGRRRSAFTMIELVVSIAVMSVVILGAISFRYAAALDLRKADIQMTATRLAQTLLEGWRVVADIPSYDPVTMYAGRLAIGAAADAPPAPADTVELGNYRIDSNGARFHAKLAYRPSTTDEPALLAVSVGWQPHGEAGSAADAGQNFTVTSYDG